MIFDDFSVFCSRFPINSDFQHLKIQQVSIMVAPTVAPPNESKLHLIEKTHNAAVQIGILASRHAEYTEHQVLYRYNSPTKFSTSWALGRALTVSGSLLRGNERHDCKKNGHLTHQYRAQ